MDRTAKMTLACPAQTRRSCAYSQHLRSILFLFPRSILSSVNQEQPASGTSAESLNRRGSLKDQFRRRAAAKQPMSIVRYGQESWHGTGGSLGVWLRMAIRHVVFVVLFLSVGVLRVKSAAAAEIADIRPAWLPLEGHDGTGNPVAEVFRSSEVLQMYHLQATAQLYEQGALNHDLSFFLTAVAFYSLERPDVKVSLAYHPTNMTISLLPAISGDGRELHWYHQGASTSYVREVDQAYWTGGSYMGETTGAFFSSAVEFSLEYHRAHPRYQPFSVYEDYPGVEFLRASSCDEYVWALLSAAQARGVRLTPALLPQKHKIIIHSHSVPETIVLPGGSGSKSSSGGADDDSGSSSASSWWSSSSLADSPSNVDGSAGQATGGEEEDGKAGGSSSMAAINTNTSLNSNSSSDAGDADWDEEVGEGGGGGVGGNNSTEGEDRRGRGRALLPNWPFRGPHDKEVNVAPGVVSTAHGERVLPSDAEDDGGIEAVTSGVEAEGLVTLEPTGFIATEEVEGAIETPSPVAVLDDWQQVVGYYQSLQTCLQERKFSFVTSLKDFVQYFDCLDDVAFISIRPHEYYKVNLTSTKVDHISQSEDLEEVPRRFEGFTRVDTIVALWVLMVLACGVHGVLWQASVIQHWLKSNGYTGVPQVDDSISDGGGDDSRAERNPSLARQITAEYLRLGHMFLGVPDQPSPASGGAGADTFDGFAGAADVDSTRDDGAAEDRESGGYTNDRSRSGVSNGDDAAAGTGVARRRKSRPSTIRERGARTGGVTEDAAATAVDGEVLVVAHSTVALGTPTQGEDRDIEANVGSASAGGDAAGAGVAREACSAEKKRPPSPSSPIQMSEAPAPAVAQGSGVGKAGGEGWFRSRDPGDERAGGPYNTSTSSSSSSSRGSRRRIKYAYSGDDRWIGFAGSPRGQRLYGRERDSSGDHGEVEMLAQGSPSPAESGVSKSQKSGAGSGSEREEWRKK